MTIWAMRGQEGSLVGFVPDERLAKAITTCGMNPIAVREVLRAAGMEIFDMQIAEPSATRVEMNRQSIPDLVIWSWIAIFSQRAASTAVELGCEAGEFWPCRFQSNPEEEFFFHLPLKVFDIVDVKRSTFRHILPVDPPIPMFIEALVTKQLPDELPPCFRAETPGTTIVFSELFVRDDFRLAWDRNAFRGAVFRRLSTQME